MKHANFIFNSLCALVLFAGVSFVHGEEPKTLLQMVGVTSAPSHLSDSVLIIIDAQREYVDGKLRLEGIDASLKEASTLLARARKAGTPVIHVMHKGIPGGSLFNPDDVYFQIAEPVAPQQDETIITKTLPNAFAGTNLEETLSRIGRKNLIVIGYMTHMCVSSTVRAALDRGYHTTIVAKATATRALPSPDGGAISAKALQSAALAELADRFATIVQRSQDIPE
jgi:nicotinamidase-related amidase